MLTRKGSPGDRGEKLAHCMLLAAVELGVGRRVPSLAHGYSLFQVVRTHWKTATYWSR